MAVVALNHLPKAVLKHTPSLLRNTGLAACLLLATPLTGFAAIPAGGKEAPKQPLTEVADLRYGVALFHYYQKDYFAALTELQLAQHEGGIQGHGVNPEIIEGGISLAFGMQTTAEHQFHQLLDESQPVEVRNTAWFYLAKLAYMRGQWEKTKESLARLDRDTLSQVMLEEADSIRINLKIRNNQLSDAATLLTEVPESSPWFGILNYNLASALGREQRFKEALPYYQDVYDREITTRYPDPEIPLALHDRARTGAGFSLLALEQYYRSYHTFNRVRLDDGQANQALLGSGWASFKRNRLNEALAPWQELLRRDTALPEVQEAQLAIPYAYEKLGAVGDALLSYASAETAFENELARINQARQQLLDGNLLTMLDLTSSVNSSWLEGVAPDVTQVINYVHDLVAQNQFQAQTQRLRDLQAMKDHLNNWQQKLTNYTDLTRDRIDFRLSEGDRVEQFEYPKVIRALYHQQWQLQQEITRIKEQKDYLAFSEPEQAELIERAQNAVALSQLLTAEISQEQIDKAQLMQGLLYWQQAQKYHIDLYQAQSSLTIANNEIKSLYDVYQRVLSLVNNANDLAPIAGRLTTMQSRVTGGQTQVDSAMAKLSDELKQDLITELNSQQIRLTYYLSEARLAIARLYDGRILDNEDAKAEQNTGGDS